ncbi:MAG: hypothetical protein GC171_04030 [Terrimonas sp.]|nr:hypothetical protein [Terrimonas sp.]
MRHFFGFSSLLFFLAITPAAYAQTPQQPVATPGNLSRIINDFQFNFQHITGELLIENPQTTEYGSELCLNGAEQCTITRYSAKGKPVYSFQAKMPATEDFNKVKKQYQELFKQAIQVVLTVGENAYQLTGTYAEPSESLAFNSILLTPDSKEKAIRKLKVEILLEADMLEWNIRVLVYDREREDDERGAIKEN